MSHNLARLISIALCRRTRVDIVSRTVMKRIRTRRIEGHYWVKVSVDRFNEMNRTNGLEVVRCLYDMVPW